MHARRSTNAPLPARTSAAIVIRTDQAAEQAFSSCWENSTDSKDVRVKRTPNTGSHHPNHVICEVLGDVNSIHHHWQLFNKHKFSPPIPFLPLDLFGAS